MKKILLAVALIGLFVVGLSSCKSTENCPAYGQVNVEQTTQQA